MNNTIVSDSDVSSDESKDFLTIEELRECLEERTEDYTTICKKNEDLLLNEFWTKQEISFYMKEINHLKVCNRSERISPSDLLREKNKMLEMESLCEDMLNAMDVVYDGLTASSIDMERVGKVITQTIRDQNCKILSLNSDKNLIFNRCTEKKFAEDPASKVTNNDVFNLIQQLNVFGSRKFNKHVMTMREIVLYNSKYPDLQLREVSSSVFNRIKYLMNGKYFPQPIDVQNLNKPYSRTRLAPYTRYEMRVMGSIVYKDNFLEEPVNAPRKTSREGCSN